MTGFLYYVDGRQRITAAEATAWGLGYAFPDGHVVCSEYSGAGPGGTQGCVIGTDAARLGYWPDRQTWRPLWRSPGETPAPPLYVGWWTAEPPTPADLVVPEPIPGHLVKLRDGREWLIPLAREYSGGAWHRALPGALTRLAGQWVSGDIDSRYARLWDISAEFYSQMFGGTLGQDHVLRFDFAGANDAAATVLGFNYRLGAEEIAALGLFDDQLTAAAAILKALIDFDTFLAWQKKNQPPPTAATSSSPAGERAMLPAMDPPGPTCGRSKRSRNRKGAA